MPENFFDKVSHWRLETSLKKGFDVDVDFVPINIAEFSVQTILDKTL